MPIKKCHKNRGPNSLTNPEGKVRDSVLPKSEEALKEQAAKNFAGLAATGASWPKECKFNPKGWTMGLSLTNEVRRQLINNHDSQSEIAANLIAMSKIPSPLGLGATQLLFDRVDGKVPDVTAVLKMSDEQLVEYLHKQLSGIEPPSVVEFTEGEIING